MENKLFPIYWGLVVKVLDSQSRGPVFKTSGLLNKSRLNKGQFNKEFEIGDFESTLATISVSVFISMRGGGGGRGEGRREPI